MSEKQVNVQKKSLKKNLQGSHKLLQAHEKCVMKKKKETKKTQV